MRRLVLSACAVAVAVFARRVVVGALVLLAAVFVAVEAQADSPLRRPLTFLPAGAILVVDPTPANAVQRILRVSPYLAPQATDRAAAQALLNSLGWVAAAEGTDLYVNLPVDCMINVSTPALHCTVDQIYETGRVKYRLAGFPADGSRLRLHLRLPAGVAAADVFLNGRRLLDPRMERGYLVVDRAWRNNEEIYYDLPERATLLGD